jgi:hypothetical protein
VRSNQAALIRVLGDADELAASAGASGSAVLVPGDRWWMRWGRPQPGMLLTRFAPLLTSAALAEHHALLASLDAVVVSSDAFVNPSASVRPGSTAVPRIGRDHADIDLASLRLVSRSNGVSGVTPRRVTVTTEDGRPLLPVHDSAAVIDPADPIGRYLGALAMAEGWELVAYGFPLLGDGRAWESLPRLYLDSSTLAEVDASPRTGAVVEALDAPPPADAAVLAARRWTLAREDLQVGAGADDAERYLAWRALAERVGLPPVVLLRSDPFPEAPEQLFPTGSPLAVRSLLDRWVDGAPPLIATELPPLDTPWTLVDDEGGHHLAELAVTWHRDEVFAGLDWRAMLAAELHGEEPPRSYRSLLGAVVALAGRWRIEGPPPRSDRVGSLWEALLPDPAARAEALREGADWLDRAAGTGAASNTCGDATGDTRDVGSSGLDDALVELGSALRRETTPGRCGRYVARAVHLCEVLLVDGDADDPLRLRDEAGLWRRLAEGL